jgi:hypothetical protein
MPRSKNEWGYASTPQYAFMAWRSAKAQGQLYLLFKSGSGWKTRNEYTLLARKFLRKHPFGQIE